MVDNAASECVVEAPTPAPAAPRRFAPTTTAAVNTTAVGSARANADATTTATTAAAGAASAEAGRHRGGYVFLRVKRKRHEDPVECLLIQSQPESKKRAHADAREEEKTTTAAAGDEALAPPSRPTAGLLSAFSRLSTAERSFVFKRVDTLESHQLHPRGPGASGHGSREDGDEIDAKWTERVKKKAKSLRARGHAKQNAPTLSSTSSRDRMQQQQVRGRERRQSEVQRSRAALALTEQQTSEIGCVRIVDFMAATSSATAAADGWDKIHDNEASVTVNGAKLQAKRILNPLEREVDEAIWVAFQRNDFAPFFRLFGAHRPDLRVDPAGFQRPADGGTVLMAAALHGRADVIEVVLRSSAANVLQEDWNGARASAFARQGGHASIETALRACEAAETEKDYVYDVYCIDTTASNQVQQTATAKSSATEANAAIASAPVVSVSSTVHRWLSQGQGLAGPGDEEEVDEFMLESDPGSHDEEDNESIDSNDENHEFNDYPDEESSGSEYDSDDSDVMPRQRMPATSRVRFEDDRIRAGSFDY